jgi:AcrR family transcriptional regulator
MAERDETRQRILEAAGPLFAEHGFNATSVRTIIEHAGVNLSAVNYHFRSKEQLYVETVRHAYLACAAAFPPPDLPADMLAPRRLRLFIRWYLTRLLLHREPAWHIQLVMREVDQPCGACADFVREFVRPTLELLLPILRDLLPETVSMDQVLLVAGSIVGQCLFYQKSRHILPLLLGESYHGPDVEQIAEHVSAFSLAALAGQFSRGKRGART